MPEQPLGDANAGTHGVDTIAQLLMLTPRRVQQLTRDGVLPRNAHGRYKPVPVVQAYLRYLRSRTDDDDADGNGGHKRRLLRARADVAEMEAAIMRGDYVLVDTVGAAVETEYAMVRANFLAMPGEIAADLVSLSAEAITEVLAVKIEEILDALSADRRYAADRAAGDSASERVEAAAPAESG